MERQFSYAQGNFLAGRSFEDFQDLNRQARLWCEQVANTKPKRSLGMSPQEAYLLEKPHLQPLPPFIPPVYESFHRVADSEGYVHLDTNRYSIPERLVGKQMEVQKYWDRVEIFFHREKAAEHPRAIARRYASTSRPVPRTSTSLGSPAIRPVRLTQAGSTPAIERRSARFGRSG